MCQGLFYLHEKEICHNDLKSANILIFPKYDGYIFKLCDFGEATKDLDTAITIGYSHTEEVKVKNMKGTTPFISPERFENGSIAYTTQQDIYAVSMVMYELLHPQLCYPWENEFVGALIHQSIKENVTTGKRPCVRDPTTLNATEDSENVATILLQYISLMEECWKQDPEDRPNISRIRDLVSYFIVWLYEDDMLQGIEGSGMLNRVILTH